jgi:2-polyprenyl-6-hydroxyphenyl methylase/3-demethylubiquinone-9 3-methyltransferase
MTRFENADRREIEKFDGHADIWWDLKGEMRTLHVINPLRVKFITKNLKEGDKVADIGCGGGVLAEALANSGMNVTGIDLSQPSIESAQRHAQSQGLTIEYLYESAENLAEQRAGQYDAVTCMEMLEHVPEPDKIIEACARLLKPGGHAFFATINRTPKAFLFVIIGGEYILRLLPRGTHTYSRLIRPDELKNWARRCGLEFLQSASLIYNLLTNKFKVKEKKEDMNYMAHFLKNL